MKKLLISVTLLFLVFFIGFNGADAATDMGALDLKLESSVLKYIYEQNGYTISIDHTADSITFNIKKDEIEENVIFNYENGVISYNKGNNSIYNAELAYEIAIEIVNSTIELNGYDSNYVNYDMLKNSTFEKDGLYLKSVVHNDEAKTVYLEEFKLAFNNFYALENYVQRVDSATKVGLYSTTKVVDKDIVLSVKKLDETNAEYKKILNTANLGYKNSVTKLTVYDINLLKNNSKVQPKDEVTLTFEVPTGYTTGKMAVFRVEDNGNLTRMPHELVNGKIQISTNHFSNYAIIEVNYEANMDVIECPTEEDEPSTPEPTPTPTTPKEETTVENPETGIGFGYGIIGLVILLGSASYVYMRKYNKFPKMR